MPNGCTAQYNNIPEMPEKPRATMARRLPIALPTLEPCPATDLLAAEPDMPVKNGSTPPVRAILGESSIGTTVTISRAPLFWLR